MQSVRNSVRAAIARAITWLGRGFAAWLLLFACLACGPADDTEPFPSRLRTPLHGAAVGDGGEARPLDLVEVTRDHETRPALPLAPGTSISFVAGAAGRLSFAAATGPGTEAQDAKPVLSVTRPDEPSSSKLQFEVGHSWTPFAPEFSLRAGEVVTLGLEGDDPVHLAGLATLGPAPDPGPRIPLMLVVMIDTLRSDHTSLAGYAVDTTPNLVRLAADGAQFDRAYTPASWTRPASASLLTSVAPERHRAAGRLDRLAADQRTWAEVARDAGYRTVAISANPNVLPFWGFARGFGRFIDFDARGWVKQRRDAADLFGRAIEIIDEEIISNETPLFLYLHPIDPHHPYDPPTAVAREIYPDFSEKESGRELRPWAKPHDVDSAIRRYDAEIRHVDAEFGRLLDALRSRDLYDEALIIVVADHGEEFFDHGDLYHGRSLY